MIVNAAGGCGGGGRCGRCCCRCGNLWFLLGIIPAKKSFTK